MPQLLKVQNLFLSSDGFGAGEGQSLERPFGHANPAELASWAGATASWPNRTDPGGSRGLDDYFIRDFSHNIGAEIMGRNKFSPYRGPARPRVAGLVGRRAAVPHPGVRADPPPAAVVHAVGHHVPLRRRRARPRCSSRRGRPPRARTSGSAAG